jgi:KUP system potassium uptake protein
VVIGVCGVGGIARHPEILRALSPTHALGFLAGNFGVASFALAAIVLAVTDAEALYADMAPLELAGDHLRLAGVWSFRRAC